VADLGEADAGGDVCDHPEGAVSQSDYQGENEHGVADSRRTVDVFNGPPVMPKTAVTRSTG